MDTEYLIIGQGLAGTLIARELLNEGKTVLLLDDEHASSSSKVAAGIINPITGRNYVKSWMIDLLLAEANHTYEQISSSLAINAHRQLPILRSLHSPKEENMWSERLNDPIYERYVSKDYEANERLLDMINAPLSFGVINNALQVDLASIISSFRTKMIKEEKLITCKFDFAKLQVSPKVRYEDIKADKIIFCEGAKVIENPYFNYLPFDPVKGEVLIINIKDGFQGVNLRDRQFITPIGNDLYWCGSGYKWKFENDKPSSEGKEDIKQQLDQILKVPYEIMEHKAAVRPATKSRKPLMGRHPKYDNVYIFNGLGTKGSTLGPYFAKEFIHYLINNENISDEVNIDNHNFSY